jgi:hypothetical protein
MRKRFLGAGALLLLAGCGGNPEPAVAPGAAFTRAQCDSYAARAIQEADLSAATSLAAQAAECYAVLRGQSQR